jgi:hypothetical protein
MDIATLVAVGEVVEMTASAITLTFAWWRVLLDKIA